MVDTPITQLLKSWQQGEKQALNQLMDDAYHSLGRIGHNLIQKEQHRQGLQTQDLIHEAYLRFSEIRNLDWRDRKHFFSVWSGIMQRVLIDKARARSSEKHGGNMRAITFDDSELSPKIDVDIVDLCNALEKLKSHDESLKQIVEMRYFMGLSIEEIAVAMEISQSSVKRKWVLAQAWLYRQLYLHASP